MGAYEFADHKEEKSFDVTLDDEGYLHEILMGCRVTGHTCKSKSLKTKWNCTRADGHTGPHVGHTRYKVVGIWENEDSDEPTFKRNTQAEPPQEVTVIEDTYDPHGWLEEA